ncbi:MAG: CAP domain-containing protein [Candidatus Micrarchaeota archaeon]|nr:CAP domain-containing protein [Candidatus Micrarchaeota archaeon]
MGGAASLIASILSAATLLLLAGLLYVSFSHNLSNPLSSFLNVTSTVVSTGQNGTLITTTAQSVNTSQTSVALEEYALGLINADRHQYGLGNVTLSNEPSGQQHSDSMIVNNYFSHWDIYGMKPYMRYTLVGGTGAVSENIAFRESAACGIFGCNGNINVKQALQQMEYDMMYNDSACCNNGHRYNILDPNHNQVSIGIAYNASSVYFTEDFIDNYIAWSSYGIDNATQEMYLQGTLQGGYKLNSVQVSYDQQVQDMSKAQLAATSSYSYGTTVAGVVSSPLYYYTGIETIDADRYTVSGNSFNVAFSMKNLISKYGAGEYTVMVWLNGTSGSGFVGSTYTVFVNSQGTVYTPNAV